MLELFKRHVAAFTSGDLDAIMSDFDDDALVITQAGVFSGKGQIRTLYQGLLEEFGVIDRGDSPGLTLDLLHVRDDMLFIVWHAESMRRVYPFATDTFICNGERFQRQSIALGTQPPWSATDGAARG